MNEDITRLMLLDNIRNCNYREEHHIDEDDDDDIRNILNSIRSNRESLHEDFNNMNQQSDSINMENIQPLSSTINDWKNNIRQNLQSNVQFESFLYYPKDNDVTVNFSVSDMNNAKIQMRLNDSSGNGIYVWMDSVQLNDTNIVKIQHIKTSYDNWRSSLIKDGTILDDIQKLSKNK